MKELHETITGLGENIKHMFICDVQTVELNNTARMQTCTSSNSRPQASSEGAQ